MFLFEESAGAEFLRCKALEAAGSRQSLSETVYCGADQVEGLREFGRPELVHA